MFVALGIQHAMLMRHIVICGLTGSTMFSTFSHEPYDLKKKCLNIKTCFDIFYICCLKHPLARVCPGEIGTNMIPSFVLPVFRIYELVLQIFAVLMNIIFFFTTKIEMHNLHIGR